MITIVVASVGATISLLTLSYIMFTEVKKHYKRKFEERIMSIGVCPTCGQALSGIPIMDTRPHIHDEKKKERKEREPMGFRR